MPLICFNLCWIWPILLEFLSVFGSVCVNSHIYSFELVTHAMEVQNCSEAWFIADVVTIDASRAKLSLPLVTQTSDMVLLPSYSLHVSKLKLWTRDLFLLQDKVNNFYVENSNRLPDTIYLLSTQFRHRASRVRHTVTHASQKKIKK